MPLARPPPVPARGVLGAAGGCRPAAKQKSGMGRVGGALRAPAGLAGGECSRAGRLLGELLPAAALCRASGAGQEQRGRVGSEALGQRRGGGGEGCSQSLEAVGGAGRASAVVLPSITRGARFFPSRGMDSVGERAPVAVPLSESLEPSGFGHGDRFPFPAVPSRLMAQRKLVGAGRGAWETGGVFPKRGCAGCRGPSALPKAGPRRLAERPGGGSVPAGVACARTCLARRGGAGRFTGPCRPPHGAAARLQFHGGFEQV